MFLKHQVTDNASAVLLITVLSGVANQVVMEVSAKGIIKKPFRALGIFGCILDRAIIGNIEMLPIQ